MGVVPVSGGGPWGAHIITRNAHCVPVLGSVHPLKVLPGFVVNSLRQLCLVSRPLVSRAGSSTSLPLGGSGTENALCTAGKQFDAAVVSEE